MTSHYDLLGVSPSAPVQTIQAAFQQRYAEQLARVNHHDPQVAAQAQQMLRMLEEARTTLSDPARRQHYDTQLRSRGAAGGLADPQAMPHVPMAAPPAPSTVQAQAAPTSSPPRSLWACPKCGTENQPNARYCPRCSQQLVRQCPECHEETSLLSTGRCSSCGHSYDVAVQRVDLRQRLQTVQDQRQKADDLLAEKGRLGCLGPAIVVLGLFLTAVLPVMLMGVMVQSAPDSFEGAATGARVLGAALFFGTFIVLMVVRSQRKHSAVQQFQPQIDHLDRQLAEISRQLASTNHQ